jgi:hypothetical protein
MLKILNCFARSDKALLPVTKTDLNTEHPIQVSLIQLCITAMPFINIILLIVFLICSGAYIFDEAESSVNSADTQCRSGQRDVSSFSCTWTKFIPNEVISYTTLAMQTALNGTAFFVVMAISGNYLKHKLESKLSNLTSKETQSEFDLIHSANEFRIQASTKVDELGRLTAHIMLDREHLLNDLAELIKQPGGKQKLSALAAQLANSENPIDTQTSRLFSVILDADQADKNEEHQLLLT